MVALSGGERWSLGMFRLYKINTLFLFEWESKSISISCFTELQTILWCTSICGIIKWKTKTVKVSGWLKCAENRITVLQFNNETIVNSSLEIQFVGWIFNQYPEEWRVRKWNL